MTHPEGVGVSPSTGEAGETWNPFNDPHPFCQMTEDHIFGAEFDKIRRRPGNCEFLGKNWSIEL